MMYTPLNDIELKTGKDDQGRRLDRIIRKALRDHPQASQAKSKVALFLCPHPTNFILNHLFI